MSNDLSAQLTIARDLVQTFAVALHLLDDTDLIQLPTTSSDRPRVSGTGTPPSPYTGDPSLARHILAALRQAHDAAVTLCDIDVCDDPLPWYTAPDPGDTDAPAWDDPNPEHAGDHTKGIDATTAIPPLATIRRHLEHLDQALADIQNHRDQLDMHDVVTALTATDLLNRPAHDDGELQQARWHHMARRARYLCQRCDNLSGRHLLCSTCAAAGSPCIGVTEDDDCPRIAPEGHKRCGACRTRLSRMTHDQVRDAS